MCNTSYRRNCVHEVRWTNFVTVKTRPRVFVNNFYQWQIVADQRSLRAKELFEGKKKKTVSLRKCRDQFVVHVTGMPRKTVLRARKKLKYLHYLFFIFNNKLKHHNVSTFLLFPTSFRKLDCGFVLNVGNIINVTWRNAVELEILAIFFFNWFMWITIFKNWFCMYSDLIKWLINERSLACSFFWKFLITNQISTNCQIQLTMSHWDDDQSKLIIYYNA